MDNLNSDIDEKETYQGVVIKHLTPGPIKKEARTFPPKKGSVHNTGRKKITLKDNESRKND